MGVRTGAASQPCFAGLASQQVSGRGGLFQATGVEDSELQQRAGREAALSKEEPEN